MRRVWTALLAVVIGSACATSAPVAVPPPATSPGATGPATAPAPPAAPAPTSAPSPTSTAATSTTAPPIVRFRARVIGQMAHGTQDFTQGLVYAGDRLIQTTGIKGRSKLQELDPETGEVRREVPLPADVFGEGVAAVGDRLLVLTWQDHKVLEYDAATFELRREYPLPVEGWGLCFDGTSLWQSDGTSTLYRRDPVTLDETAKVTVTRAGRPVAKINELECVDGAVYANVWMTEEIVRFDPTSGVVNGVIDASGLLNPKPADPNAVLNGIARRPDGAWLLTGKLWPTTFKVTFVPIE